MPIPAAWPSADTPLDAYKLAFATDPTSAFGGIIAFNRTLDEAAAEAVTKQFVEVIIAPAIYRRRRSRCSPAKPTCAF